ncbi:MAG: hypothetical protein QNJ55_12390 [Xenococcus sp. MO_188.B8]|nr:hypothetical protein [Xenococcus sp. MO_188.B8]
MTNSWLASIVNAVVGIKKLNLRDKKSCLGARSLAAYEAQNTELGLSRSVLWINSRVAPLLHQRK